MKLNLLQAHALAIAVLTATGCTPDATPSAPSPTVAKPPSNSTNAANTPPVENLNSTAPGTSRNTTRPAPRHLNNNGNGHEAASARFKQNCEDNNGLWTRQSGFDTCHPTTTRRDLISIGASLSGEELRINGASVDNMPSRYERVWLPLMTSTASSLGVDCERSSRIRKGRHQTRSGFLRTGNASGFNVEIHVKKHGSARLANICAGR